MYLLETKDIVKHYDGRRVVDRVSVHIKPGEIVGLLGPNGAGKTTIFYMIVGVISPNDGDIIFDQKDVTRYPIHSRCRLGMGYLSQEPSIFRRDRHLARSGRRQRSD